MASQQLYLFLAALFCTASIAVGEWTNGNSPPTSEFPPQVWNHLGAGNIGLIAPAGAPWGRKLILSGGFDGYKNQSTQFAFNLFRNQVDENGDEKSWILTPESLEDLFQGRSQHTANVYKDYLFNFGGAANCTDRDEPIEAQRLRLGEEHVSDDQNIHNQAPSARTGHTAVFYDEYLYVFGGYNRFTGKYLNDLWRVNLRYHEHLDWEELTPNPNPISARAGHTAVLYQDSMYIYGGQNDHGYLGDIWRYDFLTQTYVRHFKFEEKFTFPAPRSGHAAVYWVDESFYIWGGYNKKAKFLNDMWKFDLQREEWEMVFEGNQAGYNNQGFNTPSGRADFVYSVVDSKFVIIGGQVAAEGVDIKFWSPQTRYVPIFHPEDYAGDVWAYDFCAREWEFIGCLSPFNDGKNITSPTECRSSHEPVCPNQCSGHGVCVRDGHCVCEGEWVKEDCSWNVCEHEKYLGYGVDLMDRVLIVESILETGKALAELKKKLVYVKEHLPPFEEFTSCVRFHPSVAEYAHSKAAPEGKAYNDDLTTSLLPILEEFNMALEETKNGEPLHI